MDEKGTMRRTKPLTPSQKLAFKAVLQCQPLFKMKMATMTLILQLFLTNQLLEIKVLRLPEI